MKYIKIENKLKKVLSEKRYEHTLGVSFTASCLAMKYGFDINKARLAGLLHDCAKYMDDEELINACETNGLPISETERKSPYLLHGKVGAFMAHKKYDIDDEDILNSVSFHTTGRAGMSLLEKIIFVSDYIEPQRSEDPNLELIRKCAFENLDECILMIYKDTFEYLKNTGRPIDSKAVEAYEFLMKEK